MAGPLAGISAAQIAQQKLPDQAAQQANKAGPSKFDNKMHTQGAEKAQGVNPTQQAQHVQHAQQIQKMEQARQVEQAGKIDKTNLNKADKNVTGKGMDPVTQKSEVSKSTSMVMGMMDNMEKGGQAIDKLINGGLTGKNFSNSELLGLQAGMYKYTQELDLCSKVVEKATSGLKDTLKTQV
jgi:hypothetical protein